VRILHTIQIRKQQSRCILAPCLALAFSVALMPQAKAAFIGDYSLNQFTLTNTNANGFVSMTPDGGFLFLTGGNTGSGEPGTTDLTIAAHGGGIVQFDYSYSSLDFPGFDFAGYLLGSTFVQLADFDGESAQGLQFTVSSGQIFGFRVGTTDNTGEPGILTISNFSAPSGASSVPEPGTVPVVLIAAAMITCRHWRIRTNNQRMGDNQ
jgi:hypothetical protein